MKYHNPVGAKRSPIADLRYGFLDIFLLSSIVLLSEKEKIGPKLVELSKQKLSNSEEPYIGQSLIYPRLREFERNGFIKSFPVTLTPRKYASSYELTPKGHTLLQSLITEIARLENMVGKI